MVYVVYFLIIIFANTLGAISGMGGGVMIKPLLDTLHVHSLAAIGFYSSVAVFTMSISSTIKQVQNGMVIEGRKAISIGLGSVLGGLLGGQLFNFFLVLLQSEKRVQLIQIGITVGMLIIVLFGTREQMWHWQLESIEVYFSLGIFLGAISTLLGIGGGPINVTFLMLLFGMAIKEATVYSIVTIFFSQAANLIHLGFFSKALQQFDLSFLGVIIPAAILGGLLGAKLSGRLSAQRVMLLYKSVIIFVILLNILNGVRLFI